MKCMASGLSGLLTAGFPTKNRWALPGMELGAMESSKLNFFNKKMHAAKSGSPGDILAA